MIVEYINRHGDYEPYFSNRDTNHLPMAQFAIHQLGGTLEDLDRFTVPYVKNRNFQKASPAHIKITRENWKEHAAQRKHYRAFKEFFQEEMNRLGMVPCTKLYFNQLSNGMASEAFHCVIKLAYAVESENALEIANALAYLATTMFSVPDRDYPSCAGPNCVEEIIQNLEKSSYYRKKSFNGGNIAQQIENVFHDEEFFEYCQMPDFSDPKNIVYLRNTVLKAHLIKWSFTSLHLVTGLHALSLLEKYSDNSTQLLEYYWVSALATMVTINWTNDIDSTDKYTFETQPWEDIHRKAINSLNDHVIKLVYSCHQEYNETSNFLYHMVASKAVS